jgi:hypothetical protein
MGLNIESTSLCLGALILDGLCFCATSPAGPVLVPSCTGFARYRAYSSSARRRSSASSASSESARRKREEEEAEREADERF